MFKFRHKKTEDVVTARHIHDICNRDDNIFRII